MMTQRHATLYTSGQMLQIAREGVYTSGHNTLQAIVAVVFSALSLEAVVNELLDHVRDVDGRPVEAPIERLRAAIDDSALHGCHTSIEKKIHAMADALAGTRVNKGIQPFQDCSLLIEIRNALAHARPDSRELDESGGCDSHEIVDRLVSLKVIPRPNPNQLSAFVNDLQAESVAKWAYNAMVAMIDALIRLFPPEFAEAKDLAKSYGRDNLALASWWSNDR